MPVTGTSTPTSASERRYRERNRRSEEAFWRSEKAIPGAVPGGLGFMLPFPLFVERTNGCYVWDADGHQLVDLVNGDWVFPLGHRNPGIEAAIRDQLERGIAYCQPDPELGVRLAELIQARIPSMERMRFTTSGTEAAMMAMRVARVHTGRPKIAKISGGYHGTYDMSVIANGRYSDPAYVPAGLFPDVQNQVVVLPYNDPDGAQRVIEAARHDLAAVIVEPMLGGSGMIPASPEFLQRLRDVTSECDVVLIFDEVVTGTLGPHGAQGRFGVVPDLTTLGKAIGGGLPLGAFGGRADIMHLVDPVLYPYDRPVRHASTVGGIPICLAAGIAQLEQLTSEVHDHLEDLGERARRGVAELAGRHGVPLQATGIGQFVGLHWTSTPVTDIDAAFTSDQEVVNALSLGLVNAGFLLFYFNLMGVVSAPMTHEHVDAFLEGIVAAMRENDLC